MLKTILMAVFLASTATACLNTGQPASTETNPVGAEPTGTPPNSVQQGTAFSISTDAFYQASVHSPNSPGKVISLSLSPKRRAEMVTNLMDNQPPVLDTGSWTTLNNGNLMLQLRRVGEKDSFSLEFKTDGEKLVYVGDEYGAVGLTLMVKPVPVK